LSLSLKNLLLNASNSKELKHHKQSKPTIMTDQEEPRAPGASKANSPSESPPFKAELRAGLNQYMDPFNIEDDAVSAGVSGGSPDKDESALVEYEGNEEADDYRVITVAGLEGEC